MQSAPRRRGGVSDRLLQSKINGKIGRGRRTVRGSRRRSGNWGWRRRRRGKGERPRGREGNVRRRSVRFANWFAIFRKLDRRDLVRIDDFHLEVRLLLL